MVSGKVAENIRVCREPCSSLIKILGTNPYLGRHVGIVDDPPDVGHEAHVQHPIGLIQHQVGHATEVHFAFYGGEGENDVDVEDPHLPPESQ